MKKHLDFRTLVSRLIVTVVMCLPAWGIPVLAQEAESYAVFDAESATLTFRHDAAKPEGAYALNEGDNFPKWFSINGSVDKVVFDASFADARPASCHGWFANCSSLTAIEGLAYLNTEAVTDMCYMFDGCSSLTRLDLSTFNTSNVTDMHSMFDGCSSLTSLGLSTFNTSNVTDMSRMFYGCRALTSLNVSGFNTGKVTKMKNMFYSCELLTSLDVSCFNTGNVTSMEGMFDNCKKLQTLDLKNFDTGNVEVMDFMFNCCESLTSLDVSGFNTGKVWSMNSMFNKCLELPTVDVSNFNTQNVNNMSGMFSYCPKLTSVDVSKFDTRNVYSLSSMFGQCNELASVDVSHFNTQNVEYMGSMFKGCYKLASIDVTNFDTRNVTDMNGMFNGCNSLTTLDVSSFDTRKVDDMSYMFANCSLLTSLDASNFDTRKVRQMERMFRGCSKLTSLDVSSFDTRNVEYMSNMFENCNELASLDITSFDTRNVTSMGNMFYECNKLTTLDLSNFDTKQVTSMYEMFFNCKELTTIYATDKFDVSALNYDNNMFYGCEKLVGAVPFDGSKIKKEMANFTTGYFTQGKSTFGPYVVFSATDGTLTFRQGLKKPTGAYTFNDATTTPGWIADHREEIKKVVFDASFVAVKPTSCYQWFAGCTNLDAIVNFKNLKTDNVTTMASMFQDCKSLTTLDAKTLNTQNVTDMRDMFAGCENLTALDISTFDTQNAEQMGGMFAGCSKLAELELSAFTTPKAKNMSNMFSGCQSIAVLDISKFNTATVQDMSGMFGGCSALTTIYAGSGFVVTAVTADAGMFAGCERLVGASVFDEAKTGKEMANRTTGYFSDPAPAEPVVCVVFNAAKGTLTFVYDKDKHPGAYPLNTGTKVPGWTKHAADIKEVVFDATFADARPTSCYCWFNGCTNLTTITGIENLNTSEVTQMGSMFRNCGILTAIDLSKFNTSQVTDMSQMFYGCRNLTAIDVTALDTKNVTDMSSMFNFCNRLTGIDLSTFNTANVKNMSSMFAYASGALTINVANFDTRNVVNMQEMFRDCEKLAALDLSSFSTPKVENMSSMFMNDISITTIFVSDKFVITAVTSGDGMFAACHLLRGAVAYVDSKDGVKMANYTTGYFTNSAPSAPEAYAVFDADNKTLTFKFDMKRPVGAYPLNMADEAPGWRKDIYYKVEKVVFDESFARAKPTNGFMWFDSFSSLKAIDGMEHLNTEEMSNMSMMFSGCWVLKSIDLSRFNTEKVTDMSAMFKDCNDLTVLNLSTFCTDKVVDMNNMFYHCSALTNIYVSDKFVVTALTMENAGTDMFAKCDKLRGAVMYDEEKTGKEMANYTTGYLSNIAPTEPEAYVVMDADLGTMTFRYDTKKPAGAFPLNTGAETPGWIKVSTGVVAKTVVFDESFANARPTSGYLWFANYYDLGTVTGIENLNTEEMTDMNQMFYACSSLITLDLTKFNTAKVTDMGHMFGRCRSLTTILASELFVTTAVKPNDDMFEDCFSLKGAVEYDANKKGLEMANFEGYLTNPNGTGIGNVDASRQGEVEYYDLSGRRLSVPQKGVGIMRTGNKTRKSVLR